MKAHVLLLPILTAVLGAQTPVAHWRFERGDSPAPPAASEDVPGRFIYDPLARESRANKGSAAFTGKNAKLEVPLDFSGLAGQSVTIEAFVMPGNNKDAAIVLKTRSDETAAELGLALVHLPKDQLTWHGAQFSGPGEASPTRWPAGHFSSSARLSSETQDWRHLAVVYDAAAKTATCYVDYHLSRSVPVPKPLTWDAGAVVLGRDFNGLLDEVRITKGALGPAQFLRARADRISGVSFASTQQIVPRDAGCLDAKEHFGAAGDGKTDDTAALNTAFAHLANKVPLAYNTLIIPPGTYHLTGPLLCSRFIDVKGAGPEKTILKLKDGTFTDANQPQPVLRMSSTRGAPGSNKSVNGSSSSLYLEGLTIDTGRNNPGAKALEYHSNNTGRLENVILRSGDGAGVLGLDLTHHDVGPALIKRVLIDGFDTGAAIRYQEYSMTFEHVALRRQRVAGIRNQGNILALRGIISTNTVPAIISEGANSMVTLLDSTLGGGAVDQPAIRAEGGLYCRNVRTSGYKQAIEKSVLVDAKSGETKLTTVPGPNVAEYVGDQIVTGHGALKGALQLAIEETPAPAVPAVAEWVSVTRFAEKKKGDDWGPALQAAIESGARVIYFPQGQGYEFATPVRVHGSIERLVGFGGELQWAKSIWKADDRREQKDSAAAPPPLLIFDEENPQRVVILDRLGCKHVQHASRATLVLRSSSPDRYSTGAAGGKLFAEDVGGADWHFDHPQRVWVRQWNPESHAAGPCIHSQGATIWALGFKTEFESQKYLGEAGAQAEILGAFIYPIGLIPPGRPIFENRNSALSLVYGTSSYAAGHKLHIRDQRTAEVKQFGSDALKWSGSRGRMDLYTSDGR